MTQQNTSLVEESASAAHVMSDQAEMMAKLVAEFKLRGGSVSNRLTGRVTDTAQLDPI